MNREHRFTKPGALADRPVHAGSQPRAPVARQWHGITAAELAARMSASGQTPTTPGQALALLADFAERGIVAPAGDGRFVLTVRGWTAVAGLAWALEEDEA